MKSPSLALDMIKVRLDFYDEEEKLKLLKYPTSSTIEALAGKVLSVPKAEFLTYYLFHHIKVGKPGYRDYESVAKKVHLWLSAIGECIDYEGDSLRTPFGANQQLTEVSEHVGEAIGLVVMNRIHGLSEADWLPIMEQRGRQASPTFVFQIASDGQHFVQVEAKGSSVADNRITGPAVKAQKSNIDKKKAKLAIRAKEGTDPYPSSLRYGTITAVDGRRDGIVRCMLTDPPPERINDSPMNFRLRARMRHFLQWISFISPRSSFAASLATRVADIDAISNPFELDGIPLQRGNGDAYDVFSVGESSNGHSTFMATKSQVINGSVGGVTFQLSNRSLFFFGIREELVAMAAKQNFKHLITYKAEIGTLRKTVDCSFSKGRYAKLVLPKSVEESAEEYPGYVRFLLSGELNYSQEGLVFGVLKLPEE